MKRTDLALAILLVALVLAVPGCSATKVSTITEFETIQPSVSIQTISVTGPASTLTQTITSTVPASTVTQTTNSTITAITTATVTGPTTTITTTKAGLVTQGFTYVSSLTPATPGTLHFNDWVSITVDYVITDPGGAKMWALPMTNGQNTSNAGYGASGLVPPGKGTTTNLGFYVSNVAVKINQIHLVMQNSANVLLFEAYITVDYTYGV